MGAGPRAAAGVAAALAYNFFFTEPVHTFRMDRVADVVTVVVLLLVALVTSRLRPAFGPGAARRAHAARNATIAGFARRLLSCSGDEEIAQPRAASSTSCSSATQCWSADCRRRHRRRGAGRQSAHPERPRRGCADDRIRRAGGARDIALSAGRMGVPPGQFGSECSRPSALPATTARRRSPRTSSRSLPICSTSWRSRSNAHRLEQEAREFAGLRERDRVRSTLLSSIRQELGPPVASISRAAAAIAPRRVGGQVARVERRRRKP